MACNFWEIKYISDSSCEPTSNQQKLAATAAVRKKFVFIVYIWYVRSRIAYCGYVLHAARQHANEQLDDVAGMKGI